MTKPRHNGAPNRGHRNLPRGAEHPMYSAGGLHFDGQRWLVKTRSGTSVRWARVLMMNELGRDLECHEHVHHVNGDRTDDRLENLEVIDIRAHGALHGRKRWEERKARWQYEWSEHYATCVECGTTERKHESHGRCTRCDMRLRMREWRAARKAAA